MYRVQEAVGGGFFITWTDLFASIEGAQKAINREKAKNCRIVQVFSTRSRRF